MVLPDLEEKEAQPFSDEEVQVMWKAWEAGDTFVGFLLLMIYTGMMPGELCDAKKSMIDWEHQRIVGAGKKTKERKDRSIMIPDIIIPVLQKLVDHPYDSIIGTNNGIGMTGIMTAARESAFGICRLTRAGILQLPLSLSVIKSHHCSSRESCVRKSR